MESHQLAKRLGLCFMTQFMAFSSAQNMMGQIYKQRDIEWVSILALSCLYTSFGLGYLIVQ